MTIDFAKLAAALACAKPLCLHWPPERGPAPTVAELARARRSARRRGALQRMAWREGSSSPSEPPVKQLNVTAMTDGEITGLLFESFGRAAN